MSAGTELAKAYVQIIPSAEGIQGKISQALGGEAGSAGKSAGENFGSRMVGALKGVIAAAGIGKALSATLNEGAALQQSLGGVETLFKDNADIVVRNAQRAFAAAGMSANDYMEMTTGFAASLLSSLGGDTKKAASIADIAMQDMSDNSNKMGTDMESIKNAYQGFAKQNYTMLDNLKLGYGGTKNEMQRLLKDAGKLTGKTYDINNLADVYNAIHAIQGSLDITGTTAKEAATTFTGSFAAMKAAGQNVLGQLSLGENVQPQLKAFTQTVITFVGGNLLPMLGNILQGIPVMLQTLAPQLLTALQTMAPQLVTAATTWMAQLGQGLQQGLPVLLAQALPMMLSFTENLKTYAGQLVDAGLALILNLGKGLAASLPVLVQYVPTIVSNIANIINENGPKVLTAAWELIKTLGKGLIDAMPVIIAELPKIISAIVDVFTAFNWLNLGKNIIDFLGKGIKGMVGFVKDAAKTIFEALKGGIETLPEAFLNIGTEAIKGLWNGIKDMKDWIFQRLKEFGGDLIDGMKELFGSHSPSRLMRDEVGKYIPAGIAVGIEDNMGPLRKTMKDVTGMTASTFSNGLQASLQVDDVAVPDSIRMSARGLAFAEDDVVYAIDRLSSKVDKMPVNTYNVGGITYDDGSNISDAVRSLVQAARVERRV